MRSSSGTGAMNVRLSSYLAKGEALLPRLSAGSVQMGRLIGSSLSAFVGKMCHQYWYR